MESVAGLMGIEGAAVAAWYGWLAAQLPAPWGFSRQGRWQRRQQLPLHRQLQRNPLPGDGQGGGGIAGQLVLPAAPG